MPILELRDVHKTLEGKQVLRGVNFSTEKGQTKVIIGRSGSGKSVILKHIIGLMFPDHGKILIESPKDDKETFRSSGKKIAMLFQSAALFDSLSVWENVGFHLLENLNMPPEKVKPLAIEKLKVVGLEGVEDLRPSDLSGGMKKRVGLARTLMMEPEVILWDEPTAGLDPITADMVNHLILKMQRELGLTSVVVTHDMASAYKVGDYIAMLHNGQIIAEGTPDEIRKTDNPIVKQFITGDFLGPGTEVAEEA